MDLAEIRRIAEAVREAVGRVVIGQDDSIDLLLTALFAQGHVLLEGAPGTAKTLLAQSFAASLDLKFGRIQFTPDLMPGDVLGTNLFNFQTNEFSLNKGPIFTDVLLADEINRTPPKTQAALLEAMQERAVTIDGTSYELGDGFMVVATQNPIEQQGTYPLPEAQLDRFLFRHVLSYPSREEEIAIVELHGNRFGMPSPQEFGVAPVADGHALAAARRFTEQIRLTEELAGYIVDLVRATREDPNFQYGASPRAAKMLASAARARAALDGRDYVIHDDVKLLAVQCLNHRVVLSPAAEIEGVQANDVIEAILDRLTAPR